MQNMLYCVLNFHRCRKLIDLSEIVISVLLEVSTLFVVGQVLNANVSPE